MLVHRISPIWLGSGSAWPRPFRLRLRDLTVSSRDRCACDPRHTGFLWVRVRFRSSRVVPPVVPNGAGPWLNDGISLDPGGGLRRRDFLVGTAATALPVATRAQQ